LDAFMRAAAVPGAGAGPSAFDRGFQARSDVELRLVEYIGEVTEAGVFPANKAVVRETVGRHGEGIAMDAVGRRGRFGRMATNRLPALPHLPA
jgi:hypothetical protein